MDERVIQQLNQGDCYERRYPVSHSLLHRYMVLLRFSTQIMGRLGETVLDIKGFRFYTVRTMREKCMPRKMKKYIRPEKHKGVRSIPLRNPRKVDGMLMPPSPTSGPTEECFDADAKWYAIKEGKFIRI